MTDSTQRQSSPGGVGTGIKIAALVFTLGAIALAADLAWMVPAHNSTRDAAREQPARSEAPEGVRYPPPAVPPGTQPEPHIQAF